jgi:hypothetical protein
VFTFERICILRFDFMLLVMVVVVVVVVVVVDGDIWFF